MIKRKPAGDPPRRGEGGSSQPAQLAVVRELARIAAEFELEEIEFEPEGRVRICRRRAGSVAAGVSTSAPLAPVAVLPAAPGPAASAPPAPGKDDGALFVTSPFVGTFYTAPSPEAPAFVSVGQDVRKGQVVCIIEAMKLMNEIESEVDGRVTDILVKNGEHVEYGQQLLRVAKP
jgi:acetyl-CoA carboxylase biotin carboxyl carrier protein